MAEFNGDRISVYLTAKNQDMMFAELSNDFLNRVGAADILVEVPVPIGRSSHDDASERKTDARSIIYDMARVIGSDPNFLYADRYIEFIKHAVGEGAEQMLISEGARMADEGSSGDSCILLRAALSLNPKSRDALYLYGRICKACQEESDDDEERKSRFKAEALEAFELLTLHHPEFAMGYYFLGFEYLNLGLYLKAKLTWQDFLRYSSGSELEITDMDDDVLSELRDEISDRIEELQDPIRIEEGCNKIMRGDYLGGREILNEYIGSRYDQWWPLWHYLGNAEVALGNSNNAEECYRKVLQLSPSNTDAMEELAAIYALAGDEEKAEKYRNKIKIVRQNRESDYSVAKSRENRI